MFLVVDHLTTEILANGLICLLLAQSGHCASLRGFQMHVRHSVLQTKKKDDGETQAYELLIQKNSSTRHRTFVPLSHRFVASFVINSKQKVQPWNQSRAMIHAYSPVASTSGLVVFKKKVNSLNR